jgi:hypothetical protein
MDPNTRELRAKVRRRKISYGTTPRGELSPGSRTVDLSAR